MLLQLPAPHPLQEWAAVAALQVAARAAMLATLHFQTGRKALSSSSHPQHLQKDTRGAQVSEAAVVAAAAAVAAKKKGSASPAAPSISENPQVRRPDSGSTQTASSIGQPTGAPPHSSNTSAGASGQGGTSASRRVETRSPTGESAMSLDQLFTVISSKSDELGINPGEELREEGGAKVPRRMMRSTSDPTAGVKEVGRRDGTTNVKMAVNETLSQGRGFASREDVLNDPVVKLGLEVTEEKVAEWLWTLRKIVVDVVRTDQNLPFFKEERNMARVCDILAVHAWIDPLTGYCQGMCDLVSPFVVMFEDNADAFWCFEFLISRVRHNFLLEGPVGVMKQLEALRTIVAMTDLPLLQRLQDVGVDTFMFAFRMLLVLFRRELPFPELIVMWEMMWAADFNPLAADTLLDNAPNALQLKPISPSPSSIPFSPSAPAGINFRDDSSSTSSFMKGMWRRSRAGDPGSVPLKQWGQAGSGDEEISVFAVAAIMRQNRKKLMKELEAAEDALKMFNDVEFTIEVRTCVQTAVKLRKDYLKKLTRMARMSPPS
eukprot:TRINITY_DN2148_c0_g1_i2.p1 TRINITY_DN2148_c0_g1~~TRINITY_DN2148_c0_g1_i2.p1  ORF type:complete len:546 (+),score=108.00 TRINITY_DN2148_c0_g1_i2:1085-2722(+)